MSKSSLPSRGNSTTHRAHREQEREREHSFENLKSMGLKAGVLALMAGLALYPKISGEAGGGGAERRRLERGGDDGFRGERERSERSGYGSGYGERYSGRGYGYGEGREDYGRRRIGDGRGYREEKMEYGYGEGGGAYREDRGLYRRRDGVMRVDEYDMRRGEGYRERERPREQGSMRSSGGSSRTQQWVEGGCEYPRTNDYQERDRRRRW